MARRMPRLATAASGHARTLSRIRPSDLLALRPAHNIHWLRGERPHLRRKQTARIWSLEIVRSPVICIRGWLFMWMTNMHSLRLFVCVCSCAMCVCQPRPPGVSRRAVSVTHTLTYAHISMQHKRTHTHKQSLNLLRIVSRSIANKDVCTCVYVYIMSGSLACVCV